jgi:type IV secretory pathway TrbD component
MLLAMALYFSVRNNLASDFGVSIRALDGSMTFLAVVMAVWLARKSGSEEI